MQEESNKNKEKANSLLEEEKKQHKVWCLFLCDVMTHHFLSAFESAILNIIYQQTGTSHGLSMC